MRYSEFEEKFDTIVQGLSDKRFKDWGAAYALSIRVFSDEWNRDCLDDIALQALAAYRGQEDVCKYCRIAYRLSVPAWQRWLYQRFDYEQPRWIRYTRG